MRKHRWLFSGGMILLLGTILLMAAFTVGSVEARPASQNNPTVIYLFWGDGCPHCAREKAFLADYMALHPEVELRDYEVWKHPENVEIFETMAEHFGVISTLVPTTFIGDQAWVGFRDESQAEMQAQLDLCLENGCPDAGAGVIDVPVPALTATPIPEAEIEPTNEPATTDKIVDLPILGKVNLGQHSLLVSTLLISFVDGFNPCSLWVLSMLMALVIHTGSRKKVFLIGIIFLTVTAAVYALFIAGIFSVLTIMSFVGWIQIVVALVSLVIGLINVKDYFWYKEGVSLTIDDKHKPGIYKRLRNVMNSTDNIWSLIGATVVLAGGVSLIEFSCTAGFPVLWSNLLTSQNVTTVTFVGLLLVYLLVYQLDELAIFSSVVFSLKASKLEEKQGRILKLIGGMLMLTLAAVMIIDPRLMNELGTSLTIFGFAFGLALLVLLIHRMILPRFGIQIGTEEIGKKPVNRPK